MSFVAQYPPQGSGGGGGGVSSLNSLTGALTLVGGTGITVTPSGSTITITATGGGGGTPAGSNGNIQFNNSGSFGATSNLTWDNTLGTLNIGGATSTFDNIVSAKSGGLEDNGFVYVNTSTATNNYFAGFDVSNSNLTNYSTYGMTGPNFTPAGLMDSNQFVLESNVSSALFWNDTQSPFIFTSGGTATSNEMGRFGVHSGAAFFFSMGAIISGPSGTVPDGQSLFLALGSNNGALQNKITNTNTGSSAYADFVAFNNAGNATGLGILSSNYSPGGLFVSNGGFLFANAANFAIYTSTFNNSPIILSPSDASGNNSTQLTLAYNSAKFGMQVVGGSTTTGLSKFTGQGSFTVANGVQVTTNLLGTANSNGIFLIQESTGNTAALVFAGAGNIINIIYQSGTAFTSSGAGATTGLTLASSTGVMSVFNNTGASVTYNITALTLT